MCMKNRFVETQLFFENNYLLKNTLSEQKYVCKHNCSNMKALFSMKALFITKALFHMKALFTRSLLPSGLCCLSSLSACLSLCPPPSPSAMSLSDMLEQIRHERAQNLSVSGPQTCRYLLGKLPVAAVELVFAYWLLPTLRWSVAALNDEA